MIQGNSPDENEDCKKNVFTNSSPDNNAVSGLIHVDKRMGAII